VLFFSLCCDVFFSEQIEKGSRLPNYIYYIGWLTFISGWLSIMVYFTENSIMETIATVINITMLVIIIFISLVLEFQIVKLSNRVEEKQQEVRYIGVILVLYIIVAVLSLVLIITFPSLLQYIARTVKNVILTVIALLYIAAFIKPAKN